MSAVRRPVPKGGSWIRVPTVERLSGRQRERRQLVLLTFHSVDSSRPVVRRQRTEGREEAVLAACISVVGQPTRAPPSLGPGQPRYKMSISWSGGQGSNGQRCPASLSANRQGTDLVHTSFRRAPSGLELGQASKWEAGVSFHSRLHSETLQPCFSTAGAI